MKIAVVGAGAMGSVYAGLLAAAGHQVAAIDPWREHIDAINSRGLRVEGASGDRVVRLRATTEPEEIGICDLVIIATKAMQVAAAASRIAPLIGSTTLILTIQNGLGAVERIRQCLTDADNILVGVAGGFGAAIRGPGHVRHEAMELIRLGEINSGPITPRLATLAEVWRRAGFNVKAYEDIEQLIWEKFVCNVAFSGPCTVLHRTFGEMLADPEAWNVSLRCGLEAYAVGKARGVRFSFSDPESYIRDFGSRMPAARPSMLLDHLARRPSEVDAINGMVPVEARKVGLSAPANEVIVGLVKALERAFS